MSWITGLSGAELRARLRNRGYTEEQVHRLVLERDTPRGEHALLRILD